MQRPWVAVLLIGLGLCTACRRESIETRARRQREFEKTMAAVQTEIQRIEAAHTTRTQTTAESPNQGAGHETEATQAPIKE
jgi:hypothetical protein